jgi:hypothetical protein
MSGDVSLLPSVPAWRAQGSYTFLNCLKLTIYKSELPFESESPDEKMVAVRESEYMHISFLWFSGFGVTLRAFLVWVV